LPRDWHQIVDKTVTNTTTCAPRSPPARQAGHSRGNLAPHAASRAGGGERYLARHRARGKLLARERIELLLDRDAPFLELSPLAAWGTDLHVGASGVTYLALSKQAVNDHQSTTASCSGVQTSLTADKSYLYDAYGHQVSMGDRSASCAATTQPASPTMYDYGQDVHGSVGTLNKDGNTSGSASAVYSYTPYGQEDDQADQAKSLSKGDVLQSGTAVNGTTRNDNPLNPFRYSSKRYDTGSRTLDTGARRFDLGSGRFLQPDVFRGALDDLGLATDPLNQNRYAMAAANPIGYAESDGHMLIDGGGGGGASSAPTASPTPGSPAAFRIAEETTDYVPASPAPAPPPPPKHHWWDSALGTLEDAGKSIGKGTVNFVGSTGAGLVNGLTKTVTLGMYDPHLSGCAFDEAGALHNVCTAGTSPARSARSPCSPSPPGEWATPPSPPAAPPRSAKPPNWPEAPAAPRSSARPSAAPTSPQETQG
jgi:RHS repeat-associated protein